MKSKRILITGGLGFIFSHVAEHFAAKNNDVIVLDNLSDGSHPELKEKWGNNILVCSQDINEVSHFVHAEFDYIIHAAAESNVDKSINEQKAFLSSNVLGTHAMLEFARTQKHLTRFLYINTDEIYGSNMKWCSTDDKLNPSNPYSASKAAGGHLCWAYKNTFSLPIQEVRMCNIIGQRQADTKVLPRMIDRVQRGEPMPIYDGGQMTREYMDARDVCTLIEKVLEDGRETIFNLTFNQELSILDLLAEVERVLGKKATTIPASRAGHDHHYRMSPSDITSNETSGKLPHHKIKDTIKWMLS
jgi:dTDP-glucose 4,6-dehydratase